ncbi:uncharacterized protein [Physcomitrium patens]|uniref:Smr domain-containing protein n=1 Tax=Physcomitrium patens TaxID=3218 RepID=A0A2K1KB56_PHYPA|nr:pentatricopeptide repeat-containing protein At1g18900-like isoform X2 [Physcomitrium patens]XP_024381053.1 pentatricopeptide repeat-containing protein At1g18900-like isoform X2 [Physcomitrium patens]XP_024381054.1 pentatricopeptide repeat-containing protein At1g18900-like isoform X2 [Physcomitrium patens]PNR51011.1 hypothetical protein PHYPA_010197 [Physcomitrium patens]|eukprot:XP_024381052.1 pentatricopeptide repeat-containing protein At1g18900-like isoform X2 [Physcomitrella patens]
MLRPNKVLPLIKASQRSWILAGTSAGSRNSDGTCHPHGFSNADERDEHSKRIPPVSPPLSHLGNGVHVLGHPSLHPSGNPHLHNVPVPGTFVRDTVVEGHASEGAVNGQHGKTSSNVGGSRAAINSDPQPTPKVGFAALPSLSNVENVVTAAAGGRSVNNYRLRRQQSNSSSSRSSSTVAAEKEVRNPLPAQNESDGPQTSVNQGIAVVSSAGDSQKKSSNDEAFKSGWQSRGVQSKPSAFPSSPVRPWGQPCNPLGNAPSVSLSRHLSVGATGDIPGDGLPVPRSSTKERFQAASQGRTGQNSNGRSQSGNRRLNHKTASESRPANGEVVDHVCNILRQLNWRPDTLVALSRVNRTLSAFHINEVLKHQKESGLALKFFDWAKEQEGYKHDVCTYTTMIGIMGRARNFEACSRLLQEMRREGCEPCVVTYNRLIHAYGRANFLGEAMRIFYQMQEEGCSPDRVTYCTLVDLHSKAGFHDNAMDMYQKMQQAGFQPDTFTYSVIIHCLGKAGKVSEALKLFEEMVERGFAPSLVTYNIIIDLQAKSGNYVMAMKLYNDMQDAGFHPDRVTYSIMMEVLGQIGHLQEAELMFNEMEQAGWVPDAPIYGVMVDMWGKARNAERALEWYQKMLDSGLTPNVQISNSLLGSYLRMQQFDLAFGVIETMKAWGLVPTLQTHTILLSSCTASAQHHQVVNLMHRSSETVYSFVCTLLLRQLPPQELKHIVQHFFESLHGEEHDCKRGFTDSLIEFLHNLERRPEAGLVWEVGREHNLYPQAVRMKANNQYSINLHVMSMGTALVALSRTLSEFREKMLYTGVAPERIEIITGWGKHSRVPGASLVRQAVQNLLTALGSPFYVESSNVGCFVSHGKPLQNWLHQPHVEHMLLF